ncbi:hypothetical protein [Halostagnicola sp. A56]|uniref:hypothetical protein n=1 Tax=Halostagnicola sp. A56 TaxID=1495067 RepID=UPI0012E2055D|nr:hypothetical protein [Halostagnicola sp. A56]
MTETEQILEAAQNFEQREVIGLGEYTVNSNGRGSETKKMVLAQTYVSWHGLSSESKVRTWIDSKTGALIVLPKDND